MIVLLYKILLTTVLNTTYPHLIHRRHLPRQFPLLRERQSHEHVRPQAVPTAMLQNLLRLSTLAGWLISRTQAFERNGHLSE